MSAFAGVIGLSPSRARDICTRMVQHALPFAAAPTIETIDDAAFASAGRLEVSPSRRGPHLLVLDGDWIQGSPSAAERPQGLEQAAEGCLDPLCHDEPSLLDQLGRDWAFAAWDSDRRRLTLARSRLASRPIFYVVLSDMLLFGSSPQALLESKLFSSEPDWEALASAVGPLDPIAGRTGFQAVRSVKPGSVLRWYRGELSEYSLDWPVTSVRRDHQGLARELRSKTEAAVAARLPPEGRIVCQLSGGRDSSLVTALAARLAPGRVTAVTAAPLPGSVGPPTQTHFFDEASVAQQTARYLGIPHHRIEGGSVQHQLESLRLAQRWHHQPILTGVGPGWWRELGAIAQQEDARIILTGRLGNLSASFGGVGNLSDLLREEGLLAYLRLAGPLIRTHGVKTVVNQSLPIQLRENIAALRHRQSAPRNRFWRGPLVEPLREMQKFPAGALTSGRQLARELLQQAELSDRILLGFGHAPVSHPLADRELAEFCLSLPMARLIGADGGRPLFEEAFGDLLPPSLLQSRRRGKQGADWWVALQPEPLSALLRDLGSNPLIAQAVDLSQMERALRYWPRNFAEANARADRFRFLLRTVSLALFLNENFR